MLAYAIRLYESRKTLSIDAFTESNGSELISSSEYLHSRTWRRIYHSAIEPARKSVGVRRFRPRADGNDADLGVSLFKFMAGALPIEILTGGATPPYSINLRVGLAESLFGVGVNLVALLGAVYFVRAKYSVMLIYLIMVMGIQGMVMTRDLFNLFVFLEIVSVATYGLLGLQNTPAALSATFKYLMATVIASTFFLLGTVLLYAVTGMLNIDDLIGRRSAISGPIGFAALMFLLASLLVELKPFPANGWGLDVYETTHASVAALISVGVSAGVFFALLKLLPLFQDQLEIVALSGAVTFLFSNLIGLRQTSDQRLLGYSSIGQMGLLMMAVALLGSSTRKRAIPLVVAGLFVNHLFAKAGLFWLAGDRPQGASGRLVGPLGVSDHDPRICRLLSAIAGFPPFPGFWAKWHLVMNLAGGERYPWIAVVLLGSLLEAAYLFRWFGSVIHSSVQTRQLQRPPTELLPVFAAALLLVVSGYFAAVLAGLASPWVFLPLSAGVVLYFVDGLAGPVKGLFVLVFMLASGIWLIRDCLASIIFSRCFCMPVGSSCRSPVSIAATRGEASTRCSRSCCSPCRRFPGPTTSLEFLFIWELITLSSYFLIVRRREAVAHALQLSVVLAGRCVFPARRFRGMADASTETSCWRHCARAVRTAACLCAAGDWPPDQGGRNRCPCLATGCLCGGRRRRVRDAIRPHQQSAGLWALGWHFSCDTFRGRLESRACPGMDWDAHSAGGRHDGCAPG